jgi:hypothetical protein
MWEVEGTSGASPSGSREGTARSRAIPLTSAQPSHEETALLADERQSDERQNGARPRDARLIEPSRALALADFGPPKVGAGERLIRMAYRMGVSGGMLAAPSASPRGRACWPPSPIRCRATAPRAWRCVRAIFWCMG